MRTPEAIFEEVLDAWDDRERQHILNTDYPGDRGGEAMDRHTERVRYLREEFREAMAPQRYDVTGPMVEEEVPPRTVVDDPVRPAPPTAQVIDLMEALKASLRQVPSVAAAMDEVREHGPLDALKDPERPDERGERLASRYTRDDGSSR